MVVEAQVDGVASPATQVQGQTLRALLAIPVEEPQVLVYRVTAETKADGRGICGAEIATHFVVWEPSGPGDAVMKVLAFSGGGPGEAAARVVLEAQLSDPRKVVDWLDVGHAATTPFDLAALAAANLGG